MSGVKGIVFISRNVEVKGNTTNAAAGLAQFPSKLLQNCVSELTPPFYILFSYSLDTGGIPQQLKSVRFTPIYKEESRAEAKNYRAVT